jgi:hypothetical protein
MLRLNPRMRYTLDEVVRDFWVNDGFDKLPLDYLEDPIRSREPVVQSEWVDEAMGLGICDAGRFMMIELKKRLPPAEVISLKILEATDGDQSSFEEDSAETITDETQKKFKLFKLNSKFGKIVREVSGMFAAKMKNIWSPAPKRREKANTAMRAESTRLHDRKVATASGFQSEKTALLPENNDESHDEITTRERTETNIVAPLLTNSATKKAYHSRTRQTVQRFFGRS